MQKVTRLEIVKTSLFQTGAVSKPRKWWFNLFRVMGTLIEHKPAEHNTTTLSHSYDHTHIIKLIWSHSSLLAWTWNSHTVQDEAEFNELIAVPIPMCLSSGSFKCEGHFAYDKIKTNKNKYSWTPIVANLYYQTDNRWAFSQILEMLQSQFRYLP